MANAVAVLMQETDLPVQMTCADAAIAKGTVLKLSAANTVAATSADNDVYGGIAAEEKISGDGKLMIAVYRKGLFKCEAGTTGVTIGKPVGMEALNEFKDATAADCDLGYNFGIARETAANGEFFLLDLGSIA